MSGCQTIISFQSLLTNEVQPYILLQQLSFHLQQIDTYITETDAHTRADLKLVDSRCNANINELFLIWRTQQTHEEALACLLAKTRSTASLSSSSASILISSSLPSFTRSRSLLSTTKIRPSKYMRNYVKCGYREVVINKRENKDPRGPQYEILIIISMLNLIRLKIEWWNLTSTVFFNVLMYSLLK